MILDERLRWMGFWMLDKMKGGKTREYYDQIRYAWKKAALLRKQREENPESDSRMQLRLLIFIKIIRKPALLRIFRW